MVIQHAAIRAVLLAVVGPFVYAACIRRYAWKWATFLASLVWEIPATGQLSYIPPYHYSLIWKTLVTGFILEVTWFTSNILFVGWVAQVPLKKGLPLSEESKDPNGTLLSGLKAKKAVTKVSKGSAQGQPEKLIQY